MNVVILVIIFNVHTFPEYWAYVIYFRTLMYTQKIHLVKSTATLGFDLSVGIAQHMKSSMFYLFCSHFQLISLILPLFLKVCGFVLILVSNHETSDAILIVECLFSLFIYLKYIRVLFVISLSFVIISIKSHTTNGHNHSVFICSCVDGSATK